MFGNFRGLRVIFFSTSDASLPYIVFRLFFLHLPGAPCDQVEVLLYGYSPTKRCKVGMIANLA